MLPHWREKPRHEAQSWTQFNALSKEILPRADPADRDYAQQRLDARLAQHGLK